MLHTGEEKPQPWVSVLLTPKAAISAVDGAMSITAAVSSPDGGGGSDWNGNMMVPSESESALVLGGSVWR